MRVMLDTNILISMILFPGKKFEVILEHITKHHKLLLSSFVVDELFAVADRKFPAKKSVIDSFLTDLSYELVYTPRNMKGNLFEIRDMKDYPVLYSAIIENADVLITGDKDILEVKVELPDIVTPMEYIEKYVCSGN